MTLRLLTTLALSALLAACGGDEKTDSGGGGDNASATGGAGDNTPADGGTNTVDPNNSGENTGEPETNPTEAGGETPENQDPEQIKPDFVKPEDQLPDTPDPQDPKPEDPKPEDPEGGEGEGEDESVAGPGIKEPEAVGDRALDELVAFIRESDMDVTTAGWRLNVPEPPEVEFDEDKTYVWMLETDHGNLEIQLLHKVAPKHVASTAYLSTMGFYDGLSFHRIVKNFMAQGGDPLGTGNGGPAYKYEGEIFPTIRHTGRGVLSMANAGPGTDGSQFFLTFRDQMGLDGKHTVFGRVISGWATLDELEKLADPTGRDTPPEVIPIIKKARVVLREGS